MDARYAKNLHALSATEQHRLESACVVVAGLGGLGGWTAELLARAGVGHLRLVDFDDIEPTNLNRQLFATASTVGTPKTEAARRRLDDANPSCIVETMRLRIDDDNAPAVVAGMQVGVDALDNLEARRTFARACLLPP